MALGLTRPLTEMVPGIFPGVKGGRLERKADNLTVICEPVSQLLCASTACNRDNFTFLPEAVSLGVKRPGCEAGHSPPSNVEFKNVGYIPSLRHTSSRRDA
jgi:hypothetical protein